MQEDETAKKARRDLSRLSEEGGLSASPAVRSRADSVRAHFSAADADQTDKVELWATRVARGLALVAFVGLAAWLIFGFLA